MPARPAHPARRAGQSMRPPARQDPAPVVGENSITSTKTETPASTINMQLVTSSVEAHLDHAPSVEKVYKRKCKDMKKRIAEVESRNEEARRYVKWARRTVQRMRLERAFLLQKLQEGRMARRRVDDLDGTPNLPAISEMYPRQNRQARTPLLATNLETTVTNEETGSKEPRADIAGDNARFAKRLRRTLVPASTVVPIGQTHGGYLNPFSSQEGPSASSSTGSRYPLPHALGPQGIPYRVDLTRLIIPYTGMQTARRSNLPLERPLPTTLKPLSELSYSQLSERYGLSSCRRNVTGHNNLVSLVPHERLPSFFRARAQQYMDEARQELRSRRLPVAGHFAMPARLPATQAQSSNLPAGVSPSLAKKYVPQR